MARVFISYSREDIEFAEQVVQFLKNKIAYTSPLGNTPIQTAAMVLTSKKNELKEKWVPVNNGQELSSEDRYFIALNPTQDCWVYVFQIDSTG